MISLNDLKIAHEDWACAIVSGRSDNVMRLYSDYAILKPTLSSIIRRNPQDIRAYFDGSEKFGDIGFINNNWKEVRFIKSGNTIIRNDIAIDVGKYIFVAQDGIELIADYTFTYEKTVSGLKILSHHSSLPFNG